MSGKVLMQSCHDNEEVIPAISDVALQIFHKDANCDDCSDHGDDHACDDHGLEFQPSHFVKNIKVVGVHKRERPTSCHVS